jgi:hypothetical protein
MDNDRIDLIEAILEEKIKQRSRLLSTFIPNNPTAKPFEEQLAYFKDPSLAKLLRCGNRSSKTFSAMRDLAWRICRVHPYSANYNLWGCKGNWQKKMSTPEFDIKYLESKPEVIWILGPTIDFVNNVMWGQYLSEMIPPWFIEDIKKTNQGNIDSIIFKNRDILKVKSYSQQDSTKMGFACHLIYIDELPPDTQIINELIVRTLDKDGCINLAFTPLVENDDIRILLDGMVESGSLSLHSWPFYKNPLYRDNPEKLARAMDAFAHMSPHERAARISGDWYIEPKARAVFENVDFEIVEDFPIPNHWRQARVVDPASHTTGIGIFAEDPTTGIWYCTCGDEFTWGGGKLATASDIIAAIEKKKPHPKFRYILSIYDNSEAWFGAESRSLGFQPCLLKNRQEAIMCTRDMLHNKKIKIFRVGAAKLVEQINNYRYSEDGKGGVVKKDDHCLDTLMYFSRQMPTPLKKYEEPAVDEKKEILQKHIDAVEKRKADKQNLQKRNLLWVGNLQRRRAR